MGKWRWSGGRAAQFRFQIAQQVARATLAAADAEV